ncbi:hypothetical protein AB0C90_34545 [Streptomyces sp. NPDC048550]|uniref:hypothetical protein n=1 Tax=unclassified Streptomyces TaxID=2593676 RepID=UPI003421D788
MDTSWEYPFWQRHRYTRSTTFPRLHVVLAGKAEHLLDNRLKALTATVRGITIAVWVNTLPRLQRGEPWYEVGVDDPNRRRERYPLKQSAADDRERAGQAQEEPGQALRAQACPRRQSGPGGVIGHGPPGSLARLLLCSGG